MMKHAASLVVLLAALAPASASPFIDYPDSPDAPVEGTVEIVVPPQDLARCQMTLAAVLSPPVEAEAVAMPATSPNLPVAICVTEESKASS